MDIGKRSKLWHEKLYRRDDRPHVRLNLGLVYELCRMAVPADESTENAGPWKWWTEIQSARSYVSIILFENAVRNSNVYSYLIKHLITKVINKARQ